MVKAVALVALHLCAKAGEVAPDGKILRPAVIETKPPGSLVDLDKDEYAAMKKASQVRDPTEDELTLDKASRSRRKDSSAITAAEKAVDAAKAALDKADADGKAKAEADLAAAEAELAKLTG